MLYIALYPKTLMVVKGFFQFEIIITFIVSFEYICYESTYFYSSSAGIDFNCQNLTSTDVRFSHRKSTQ